MTDKKKPGPRPKDHTSPRNPKSYGRVYVSVQFASPKTDEERAAMRLLRDMTPDERTAWLTEVMSDEVNVEMELIAK